MVDSKTIAVYNARAKDYIRLTASTKPDTALSAFMSALPRGARVLDLGCGPGTASVHMRAAGLVPLGIDASTSMVTLATETYALDARVGTFEDIPNLGSFDAVWANFSLLHAPRADLPRHLSDISMALPPGGLFHIGMKTGTGEERDPIDRRYTYVTVSELELLLKEAGMTPIHVKEGKDKGLSGRVDPFVIMRATRNG